MNEDQLIELVSVIIGFFIILVFSACKEATKNSKDNNSNTIRDVSGHAFGTNDYKHPCTGQCEDQTVILNKSPTPRYKHNCHAPCAFATRSGRYYKGIRRIQTW